MKKRIVSVLFVLAVVFALAANAFLVYAADGTSLTVTASAAEARPGDTLVCTVDLGPVTDLYSIHFGLQFSDGLTYVEGSGQVAENLQDIMPGTIDFADKSRLFLYGAADHPSALTSEESTTLMTFQVKINEDASGTQEVSFKLDPAEVFTTEYETIECGLNSAAITVSADAPAAPEPPAVVAPKEEPSDPAAAPESNAAAKYSVQVIHGAAAPAQAAEGETVTILADEALEGETFGKWVVVSGDVTLESETESSTTFQMPAGEVEIKAVYAGPDGEILEDVPAEESGEQDTAASEASDSSESAAPEEEQGGSAILWVVLAVLAVGGAAGAFYYKKSKK